MLNELKKIDYYLEEVKRHWNENPDFVSGCQFYSIWEKVQKPVPFALDAKKIEIAGILFELTEEESGKVACFSWDENEECPALLIEGDEWSEKIVLSLEDGEPLFFKQDPIYLEKMGLSYGERLEIIYDVIAYLKGEKPGLDILKLKKNDFLTALDALEQNYDSTAMSVMKKLSMQSIERFIKKASEDMTHDDLSAQLHLPLDGTYASRGAVADKLQNGVSEDTETSDNLNICVTGRTDWAVIRDLAVQENALRLSLDEEKSFILSFADAEILDDNEGNEIAIKMDVAKESPLEEGDVLKAFYRGSDESVGSFRVDLFDSNVIYGRMRFLDSNIKEDPFFRLYALPRRSPLKFLSEAIEDLIASIEKQTVSDLFMKITGLIETPFFDTLLKNIPEDMDFSQRRAWSCAVNTENAVTLVQGPPGTGKTKVLVDVVRHLCNSGKRILVTAPSNTAVDNICRKISDLPLLRFGKQKNSISSDVSATHWIGEDRAVMRFADMRKEVGGGVYAGTHIGLLWDDIVRDDMAKNGPYDSIIFDEAGMASINEFLLLSLLAEKAVLFGDHKQLPPFPLSDSVKKRLDEEAGPFMSASKTLIDGSALEWLAETRRFPVILLKRSYRCQNPRLLRFSSILFYDALVSPSEDAEYFKLPYAERIKIYPPSTLKLISTSDLPEKIKFESLVFEGMKPGIENDAEAVICIDEIYRLLQKFSPDEITLIAPYKRQVRLVRSLLSLEKASELSKYKLNEKIWERFLENRISTVDSFQGGESDAVIICYVRSNDQGNIGFVDDANRINVAHTRCRKEMVVIGDIECLKREADSEIFKRLERTIRRDGEIIKLDTALFGEIHKGVELDEYIKFDNDKRKEKSEKPQPEEKLSVEIDDAVKEGPPELDTEIERKKDTKAHKPKEEQELLEDSTDNEYDMHQPDLFV